MDMFGELRQVGESLNEVGAKSNWMWRSKAQPLQTIDLMHSFQQLDEWALSLQRRKFVSPIKVHDLPEQGHLPHTILDQPSHFGNNRLDRTTSFLAPRLRHDAKGTMHIAPLHNGNERRRLPLVRRVITDGFG